MARPGTLTCIRMSPECAAAPAACWRRCGVTAVSTFIVTCVPSSCLPPRQSRYALARVGPVDRESAREQGSTPRGVGPEPHRACLPRGEHPRVDQPPHPRTLPHAQHRPHTPRVCASPHGVQSSEFILAKKTGKPPKPALRRQTLGEHGLPLPLSPTSPPTTHGPVAMVAAARGRRRGRGRSRGRS
jgi:hypothetical protein